MSEVKTTPPHVIVIAGPNGAGKSTAAPEILRGALSVTEFVNADVIARGLSAFDPESVALPAGKVMLLRLRELAADKASFAFETTLASRSFAQWIKGLRSVEGYRFHLAYFWLPSAEMAVARVASRVRANGHHVPDETVRRRYQRGLHNFFNLYRPIADTWIVYNGGTPRTATPVATGKLETSLNIVDDAVWRQIERSVEGDPR